VRAILLLSLIVLSGCAYYDEVTSSVAHNPRNDPYYWSQVSSGVGNVMNRP
jgi:hypothetical protein